MEHVTSTVLLFMHTVHVYYVTYILRSNVCVLETNWQLKLNLTIKTRPMEYGIWNRAEFAALSIAWRFLPLPAVLRHVSRE